MIRSCKKRTNSITGEVDNRRESDAGNEIEQVPKVSDINFEDIEGPKTFF